MTSRKPRSFALPDDNGADQTDEDEQRRKPSTGKTQSARKPRAFKSDMKISMISDDEANGIDKSLTPPPLEMKTRRAIGWAALLVSAVSALIALAIAVAIDNLITQLFQRHEWLGWAATAITAVLVIALVAIITREIWAIARLRSIARLREQADQARQSGDLAEARSVAGRLHSLYANNPNMANARTNVSEHRREIVNGTDLIEVTEREFFAPLDRQATETIMNAAKRVSLVTAVSPRASIDIAYVLMENLRLIRALSQLYGGRPGTLGFLRLSRNVVAHLAATGAIAVGDSLLQQFIGHGIAAKLSTRLGEGVLNGLLTVRIGISAMDICRPMTFHMLDRPGVGDFLSELTKLSGSTNAKEDKRNTQ